MENRNAKDILALNGQKKLNIEIKINKQNVLALLATSSDKSLLREDIYKQPGTKGKFQC